ncbi:unnamed protein product, partial [marine sediment metagenome]
MNDAQESLASDAPNSLSMIYRCLPTTVDVLTVVGYFLLVPGLGSLFLSQSPWNHVILLPGYLLLMVGVVLIRKLPSYSVDEEKDPGIISACLVFFLIVVYSMLYTTATDIGGGGKGNDAA